MPFDRYLLQVGRRTVEVYPKAIRKQVKRQVTRARNLGLKCDLCYEEWLAMLVRFRFKCAYCGSAARTIGHIVPVANGGGTTAVNVLPCCWPCNHNMGTAVWLPAHAGEVCYGH
jgi:5-methylcytosine-specific restriction endonuclease McrA